MDTKAALTHARRLGREFTAVVAASMLWPLVWAQDLERPVALVTFEVEAEPFKRNLPEQASLRVQLAESIAAEFGKRYAFAEWSAGPAEASRLPIGALVARLVSAPAVPLPSVSVKWFGKLSSGSLVELALPPVEVYSPSTVDRESNNRIAFATRLEQLVLPLIRTDSFQRQFQQVVAANLPFASSASLRVDERVVIIPRLWKHLRMKRESRLKLHFERTSGSTVEVGSLKLRLPSARTRDPMVGWLEAAVDEASIGAQLLALDRVWEPAFEAMFKAAKVACFIEDYQIDPFPQDAGGVAITPDGS